MHVLFLAVRLQLCGGEEADGEVGIVLLWLRSALHWEMTSTDFQGQTQGGGGSGSFLEQLKNKGGGERNLYCPEDLFAYGKLPLLHFHVGILD